MDGSRIKDVGSLLSAFFEEEKLRRGGRYAQFFESWRAVVGEHLAAHSRVVDLDKGILIVEAEHPGWIQLLQLRQTQTQNALARRFPDLPIRGIAFRLSGAEYRPAASAAPGEAAAADSLGPESAEDASDALPDDEKAEQAPGAEPKDPDFMAAVSSLKKAIREGNSK